MLSGTKTLPLNFKFPTEIVRFALAVKCGLKSPDFEPNHQTVGIPISANPKQTKANAEDQKSPQSGS
jgi:hypothetical protein